MYKQKDIQRMSKRDLLEILVLQSKKIDELEVELNKTKKQLETKQIIISEAGSIAEASLKLNKIFEIAQQSANQYLENIKRIEQEKEEINIKLKNEYQKINKKKQINNKKTN